jgi:hypothetical protein
LDWLVEEIFLDHGQRFSSSFALLNGSESGGDLFPARFFASSGPAVLQSIMSGERKEEP